MLSKNCLENQGCNINQLVKYLPSIHVPHPPKKDFCVCLLKQSHTAPARPKPPFVLDPGG